MEFSVVLNLLAPSSVQDAVSSSEKCTTLGFSRVAGALFCFIVPIFPPAKGRVLDSTPELELLDSMLSVESLLLETNISDSERLRSPEDDEEVREGPSSSTFSLIESFCMRNVGFSFSIGQESFLTRDGGLLTPKSTPDRPPLLGMP